LKNDLQTLIAQALQSLRDQELLPDGGPVDIPLDRTRDRAHGDFASAIALVLAKTAHRKPRELAEQIAAALPTSAQVARVEVAGPGFINFFLTPAAYQAVVGAILDQGDAFGRSVLGGGRRMHVDPCTDADGLRRNRGDP